MMNNIERQNSLSTLKDFVCSYAMHKAWVAERDPDYAEPDGRNEKRDALDAEAARMLSSATALLAELQPDPSEFNWTEQECRGYSAHVSHKLAVLKAQRSAPPEVTE